MVELIDVISSYLRSFKKEEKSDAKKKNDALIDALKKGKQGKQMPSMPPAQQAETILKNVLAHSSLLKKRLSKEKEAILDPYSWKDLHLLEGDGTTPDASLLNCIKRTQSMTGAATMATELVTPHRDADAIKKEQEATKFLLEKSAPQKKLNDFVEQASREEDLGIALFRSDNPLHHREYKKELKAFSFQWWPFNRLNSSPFALQIKKIWHDIWLHPLFGVWFSLFFLHTLFFGCAHPGHRITAFFIRLFGGSANEIARHLAKSTYTWKQYLYYFFVKDQIFPFISLFTYHDVSSLMPFFPFSSPKLIGFFYYWEIFFMKKEIATKLLLFSDLFIGSTIGFFFFYRTFVAYRKKRGILSFLMAYLRPLQRLIRNMRKINHLVKSHPELEKSYGGKLIEIRKFLEKKEKSADAITLFDALESLNLEGEGYFFRYTGKMLHTYHLFEAKKKSLAEFYYALGSIDSLLSRVRLIEEGKNSLTSNGFEFVQIKAESGATPSVMMEKMWHVALDRERAISNNVFLDADQGPQTMIITGPNGGGKSSYILGMGSAVLLNQTYGIGPYKACEQVIFDKILTYVNPIQNLAKGLSLAQAGMAVLKEHQAALKRISGPMLFIIDEILNGVDPKVAEKNSYKILEERSKKHNNFVASITTHYQKLTELAQNNTRFENRKVVVKIPGKNGRKFDYTFEILRGIAKQNIVEDMLEDFGITQ